MRREHTDAAEPTRSCVGCRARRPGSALVRVTASERGIVVDGPSDGRGAWLCRAGTGVEDSCLDTAIARRAFGRAWRREVGEPEHRSIRAALDRERRDPPA